MTHFILDLGALSAVNSFTAKKLESDIAKTLIRYFSQINHDTLKEKTLLSLMGLKPPLNASPKGIECSAMKMELTNSVSSFSYFIYCIEQEVLALDTKCSKEKPPSYISLTTPTNAKDTENYLTEQVDRLSEECPFGIVEGIVLINLHYQELSKWAEKVSNTKSESLVLLRESANKCMFGLLKNTLMLHLIDKAGLATSFNNFHLITDVEFKKQAKEFSVRFKKEFGFEIKQGKLFDVFSECLGFQNGHQQLKKHLVKSNSKKCFPDFSKENIKRSYWQAEALFDDVVYPEVEVENIVRTTSCLENLYEVDKGLRVEDLKETIDLFSAQASKLLLGTLRGVPDNLAYVRKEPNRYFGGEAQKRAILQRVYSDLVRASSLFLRAPKEPTPRIENENTSAYFDIIREFCLSRNWAYDALVEVFEEGFCYCGFELSMIMKDEYYWDLDRNTSDDLDELIGVIENRLRLLNWIWIEANPQVCKLKVGDSITKGKIRAFSDHSPGYYEIQEPSKPPTEALLITFERALRMVV